MMFCWCSWRWSDDLLNVTFDVSINGSKFEYFFYWQFPTSYVVQNLFLNVSETFFKSRLFSYSYFLEREMHHASFLLQRFLGTKKWVVIQETLGHDQKLPFTDLKHLIYQEILMFHFIWQGEPLFRPTIGFYANHYQNCSTNFYQGL